MSAEYVHTIHGMRVQVDKVGRGTLGKAYEGRWSVTVTVGPIYVYDNDELITGTAKTHHDVAVMAAEFAGAEIDAGM